MKELFDFLFRMVMVYPLIIFDSFIIIIIIIRGFIMGKRQKKIMKCVDCLLRMNGGYQEKESLPPPQDSEACNL